MIAFIIFMIGQKNFEGFPHGGSGRFLQRLDHAKEKKE